MGKARAHRPDDGHAMLCPSYAGFIFNCAFPLSINLCSAIAQVYRGLTLTLESQIGFLRYSGKLFNTTTRVPVPSAVGSITG
jgi:hypothetical protein